MADQSLVLLKLSMGRYPAVSVTVPFDIVPEVCKYYFDSGDAISYITGPNLKKEPEDPRNAIYISDLEVGDQCLSLLLVRGDPGRAIPGYVNPSLRSVKIAENDDPDYVPGASCHVVISNQEIVSGIDQGRYRVAMEKTRGIGRSLVRDFLVQLLARFAEEYPDRFSAEKVRTKKGEKPETIEYRPTIKLLPQANGNLEDDLQEGKIGGFRLTRGETTYNGEAGQPDIKRLDVKLHAQIVPTKDIEGVKNLIKGIRELISQVSFENLNLELEDDDGEPIGGAGSIKVSAVDDSDLRYSKLVSIPRSAASENECISDLFSPTKDFAMKCLSTEKYWK